MPTCTVRAFVVLAFWCILLGGCCAVADPHARTAEPKFVTLWSNERTVEDTPVTLRLIVVDGDLLTDRPWQEIRSNEYGVIVIPWVPTEAIAVSVTPKGCARELIYRSELETPGDYYPAPEFLQAGRIEGRVTVPAGASPDSCCARAFGIVERRPESWSTCVQRDGSFCFDNLHPGAYNVVVTGPNGLCCRGNIRCMTDGEPLNVVVQ